MAPNPSWSDASRWAELLSGESCPICDEVAQPRAAKVVADLPACLVVVDEAVAVHGYCRLLLKRHAAELHELTIEEAAAFIEDVRRVSSAVQQATGAVKLNYEILGNIVPHVHMHIVPRYRGDEIERTGGRFNEVSMAAHAREAFRDFAGSLERALRS